MRVNFFRYPRLKLLSRLSYSADLDRDLLYGYTKYQNVGKYRYLINEIYQNITKCRRQNMFVNHFVTLCCFCFCIPLHFVKKATKYHLLHFVGINKSGISIPLYFVHFATFTESGIYISLNSGK